MGDKCKFFSENYPEEFKLFRDKYFCSIYFECRVMVHFPQLKKMHILNLSTPPLGQDMTQGQFLSEV